MSKFVTDTMAFVLYLEKRKLPQVTKEVFEDAEKGQSNIIVPGMVLAEVAYLSERGRIQISLADVRALLNSFPNFAVHPLDEPVVSAAFSITDIPEMHDRLIAGTARLLSLPLLTNDPAIENSAFVSCIWK